MEECDNSKIHIGSNFLLSVCLLIMLDTLLLGPSLHCNTSLHFTTLHPTTLHYTYRHFTSSHLHFTTLSFGLTLCIFYRSISPHITKLDTVQFSQLQTNFQNNEPLHWPKQPLTISLHILFIFFFHLSYQLFTSLYFAVHIYYSLPFTYYFL